MINEKEKVKKNGCKMCSLYEPNGYCKTTIIDCPNLLERDFFAGRIDEKEYKKILAEEAAALKAEKDFYEKVKLDKKMASSQADKT